MTFHAAVAKFHADYRVAELMIREGDAWIVSLRPGQLTLGSMLISSKTDASSFASFDPAGGVEFFELVRQAERAVAHLFGAVRINCIALMMKDPIVHFHLIPRYQRAATYLGRSWEDPDWPKPPTFRDVPVDADVIPTLVAAVTEAFNLQAQK